jgi:hypothetical protein
VANVKFTWHPGDGSLPFTLGDDLAGDKISGERPSLAPGGEAVPAYGAAYAIQVNHENRVYTKSWRVERDHGSLAAARQFKADHPGKITNNIGISQGFLEEADDGTPPTIRFLTNARFTKIECLTWDGETTIFQYEIQAGTYTQTAPKITHLT